VSIHIVQVKDAHEKHLKLELLHAETEMKRLEHAKKIRVENQARDAEVKKHREEENAKHEKKWAELEESRAEERAKEREQTNKALQEKHDSLHNKLTEQHAAHHKRILDIEDKEVPGLRKSIGEVLEKHNKLQAESDANHKKALEHTKETSDENHKKVLEILEDKKDNVVDKLHDRTAAKVHETVKRHTETHATEIINTKVDAAEEKIAQTQAILEEKHIDRIKDLEKEHEFYQSQLHGDRGEVEKFLHEEVETHLHTLMEALEGELGKETDLRRSKRIWIG
jgi:hypothetical protein